MRKFIILFVLLMLVGCASKQPVLSGDTQVIKTSPASGKELDKAKDKIEIDPELLKECSDFINLQSKNPTPNDVLVHRKSDVAIHFECKDRHKRLIKIVRDAFNLRE